MMPKEQTVPNNRGSYGQLSSDLSTKFVKSDNWEDNLSFKGVERVVINPSRGEIPQGTKRQSLTSSGISQGEVKLASRGILPNDQ